MGEIHFKYQAITFLLAVFLGLVLCFFYDIIRVFHNHYKKSGFLIVFADILYFILSAIISYLFLLLRCLGNIRFFVFVGEAVGFLLCRKVFSDLFVEFCEFIIQILKNIIKVIKVPFVMLTALITKILLVIFKFVKKFFKKSIKRSKNT